MTLLQIGSLNFNSHLIQSPLAGVSAAPFRRLVWRFGGVAYTSTEMLSCKTLLKSSPDILKRYISRDKDERVLCFQLSGNDPKELSEAVQKATDLGANLIDLNCGCPVKKIRVRGAGSALLSQPTLLYQLISAMKQHTHVPVTLKIRVDAAKEDKFNQEMVNIISDSGLDALIVHGRHWSEKYDTPCHYDEIEFFASNLKIPVIGNGDVACRTSLANMLKTGCKGAMIGRAGVGQPWIFAELSDLPVTIPSLEERGELLLEHVAHLIHLVENEKLAIFQARSFGKYYARGCEWRMAFAEKLNACEAMLELKSLVKKYFR